MTPIRALSRAAQESAPGAPGTDADDGARRGRHRKPRPRKVLLAAGGLALAAGVLSLVRVAPESGVGVPGTAEAEPRPDHGGGATEGAARTAATVAAGPTALPSATSAMGGRSLAPADSGTPTALAATDAATDAAPPGETAVPTTVPTGAPVPPGGTPRPSATTSAPRPAPTASTPAPTPTPSRGTEDPDPGGLCLPVISLCVDVLGDRGRANN
ncbi:hypothetical protein ABT131_21090 [Streptomyces sp900105245]|uniref:hypothetical protein n=1 Tax=Streptomyces sp. 900105245 TaxID=3154379 RepID=UPI00333183A1